MRVCTYEKCNRKTKSLIKGLCPTCYARFLRNGTAEHVRPNRSFGIVQCSFCDSKESPFIKGLCRRCYQREYKNGTPEPQRARHLCEMPGCDDPVASHGLCQMHAMRFRRHGDADAGRPDGWGSGAKHPLYERWKGMRRISKQSGGIVPAWDKFWTFLQDVGDAPSAEHRLYRVDNKRPFGPGNFVWRELIGLPQNDRVEKNAYMRAWSKARPHLRKALYLKRHYGVTIEWYDSKFASQNGVCAICQRSERRVDKRTGRSFLLAVDHDHVTGDPRELLCSFCNHGLGNFKDSVQLMQVAIAYLEKHAATPFPDLGVPIAPVPQTMPSCGDLDPSPNPA